MKKYEYRDLYNLPSIHPDYDDEFNELLKASFILCEQTLHDGDLGRAKFMNRLDRLSIIHLLIKLRFDQSYAVPFSKKTIKYYEKVAQLYYFIFLGCEHFFQDTSILIPKYRNAANWFIEILMEKAVEGEFQATKRKTIDKIKEGNRQLSNYENLFNGSPFIHTSRFFSLLLKKAQEPTDLGSSLNKNILQPFKKARRQWSKDFRTNPDYQLAMIDSESGKELYQMQGSGSGRYEICPLDPTWVREAYWSGILNAFMNSPEKIVTFFDPGLSSYVVIKKET